MNSVQSRARSRSRSSSLAAAAQLSRERSTTLTSIASLGSSSNIYSPAGATSMSALTTPPEAGNVAVGVNGIHHAGLGIVGAGLGMPIAPGAAGSGGPTSSGGGSGSNASTPGSILPPTVPPPPVPSLQGKTTAATGKEAAQNPDSIYKNIQEASAKRISSLDYLKKTHEPRVFWFNTLLYTQPDIARLPSFSGPRLARRAANFLLLGVSLPSVVDLNTSSPTDYLRALNALLMEFEDYEKQHPSDGASAGSLSRARFPSMFKRSGTTSGKRRASSAADIGLPMQSSDPQELAKLLSQNGTPGTPGGGKPGVNGIPPLPNGGVGVTGGVGGQDVMPSGELAAGEDFTWLRTPSIPFEPDFFEVFVTLCDMLIECYSRIATLVSSPSVCIPETGEVFAKADRQIRRVVFEGIIKDYVDQTRTGVRNEIAGIGKVILGGLL